MRIYDRAGFLKLPEGTFFSKGVEWSFGCLSVKGESTAYNDFYCCDLDWVDGKSSEECFDRLDAMLKKGASFPVQDSGGRDGLFDEDAIFLVWERADLEKLRGYIDAAIALSQGAL